MSFVTDVLNDTVARIEVETTLGPKLVINRPFAPSSGPPSGAVAILKPKITLYDRDGDVVSRVAPAGDPGISKWPLVVFGLGVLLAMTVRGAVR